MVELWSPSFEWVCTLFFTALSGEKVEEACADEQLGDGKGDPSMSHS